MAQITLNSTGVASDGALVLQSNGTTAAVTIDTSQNVGIGVTPSAGQLLVVGKNITGAVQSAGVSVNGTIQSGVTSVTWGVRTNLSTVASAFTLANLRHHDATQGTFGAGSTVTNQAGFFVDNSLIGATNNYGFFGNIPSGTNRWNFYAGGTADNYMAGNLGIGTNTPAALLDVDKSQNSTTSIRVGNTNAGSSANSRLIAVADAGNIQIKAMSSTNTTYGAADCGVINCDTMAGGLRFSHNDTVGMTFAAAGNLGIGVTPSNANGGVLQLKSGITFPATQVAATDANTLDDYEEGTFTPTLTRSGTAPTVTYTIQGGFYTKIGNMVTCTVALGWSANTGGTGYWYVASLPFTSKNSANCVASSAIGDYTGFTLAVGTTQVGLEVNPNVTYGVFQCSGSAVTSAVINTVAATGSIYLSFTYFTA
jgi:hypothetical protein